MKVFLSFFMLITSMFFTGCIKDSKIINYTLNDDNQVIVVYESGNQEVIGELNDVLSNNQYSIFPSTDGYYIINGVKTTIETLSYKVNFITNTKTSLDSQIIKWREKVKAPIIEKVGYKLDGWYNEDDKWDFDKNIVDGDLNLVAKWIPNQYKIIFNQESVTDALPIIIRSGETYNLPKLQKNGYEFLGWSYENNIIPFKGIFNYATDIELVAKWSCNQYAIHFETNNDLVLNSMIVDKDMEIYSLPIPVKQGYKFLGWFNNDEIVTFPFKINNSIELTAKWQENNK